MITTHNKALPAVEEVTDACFKELDCKVQAEGLTTVPDDLLLRLHHLCGKNWLSALRIVDEAGVKCLIANPSGRKLFRVNGKSPGDHYTVFPEHYCSCQAFFFEVVNRSDALYCKHQLAARLAAVLRKCQNVTVTDLVMAQMLMQSGNANVPG